MSNLNIPQDNIPSEFKVDSTSSFSQPQSPLSSDATSKDKMFGSEPLEKMKYPSRAIKNESEIPQLAPLNLDEPVSFAAFLETVAMANYKTKQALRISEIGNFHQRYLQSLGISNQVMTYTELEEARNAAMDGLDEYVNATMIELQNELNEINYEIQVMQSLISEFNQGNAESKQACIDLVNAYQKMINDLKALGITQQENGSYYVPFSQTDEYNAIINEYQESVNEFNTYWDERNAEIAKMNEAIKAYNLSMQEHQQYLENFAEFYDFRPFSQIPRVDPIKTYNEEVRVPPLLREEMGGGGQYIMIYSPPSYVYSYAQNVPNVTNLDTYREHYSGYTMFVYNSCVNKINEMYSWTLKNGLEYWTFLGNNFDMNVENDPSVDLILNNKPLFFKFFELNIKYEKLKEERVEEVNKTIKKEDFLIDHLVDKDIKTLLGDDVNQEFLSGITPSLTEIQAKELSNYIDILSLETINQNLLGAVFPSLSPIGNIIASIPKDSPAYGLLFSISFLNRIIEHVNADMSKTSIEVLLNKIPAFSHLNEDQKRILEANMNVGLLLIAGKFVEANLGFSGFLEKILSEVNPQSNIHKKSIQFDDQKIDLIEWYIHEGYPKDEATFLANVAIDLLQCGVLSPSIPFITEDTVNKPLLINTLTSALILSENKISLSKAKTISEDIISMIFSENPKLTTKQFRNSLENYLQDEGIGKNYKEITKDVVILMKENPNLTIEQLNEYVLSLLSPQIGQELAKEVSEEIHLTLFGTSNPSSSHTTSPYFLIQSFERELKKTSSIQDQSFKDKQTNSFNIALETSLNLSAFLLKMMDPAYSIIHSSQTGLIYTSNTKERPLII